MDYLTNPVSRKKLREFAFILRTMFDIAVTGKFPVLDALEKLHIVFPKSFFTIVDDSELPATIPARCVLLKNGGFEIQIRQTTYDGAYKHIGAYRDHITHEICHVFLYNVGFTPIMQRTLSHSHVPCYCTAEWQAKALCGEVMMPYDETSDMYTYEIEEKYGVSSEQANYRMRY